MGIELGLMALSGVGAAVQGMAGAAQSNYQAQVADNNAKLMEFNAVRASQSAAMEAERTGMKGREQQGMIAAIQGASGLEIGSGTSAQVMESAGTVNRYDQLLDTYKGAVNSTNMRNQGQNYLAEAQLRRMSAQNSMLSGALGMSRSLLSGAGSFSSKWMDMFNNSGGPIHTPRGTTGTGGLF